MPVVDRPAPGDTPDRPSGAGRSASRHLRPWVFAAIVVLAAAFRFPALDLRPMHTDEGVHAAKFGRLLQEGVYEYDADEFHGPTLNYLTLIPARLRGIRRYADLDEVTLRCVPAAIGVLLVAAHLLIVPVVGYRSAALAALLAAVSPAMVYYSRYYIQETLLVAFSFAALLSICRYLQAPSVRWAVTAGTSVGLMYATKETWLIAFGSMVGALGVTWVFERWRRTASPFPKGRRTAVHLAVASLAAVTVSGLFLSSFFSHPQGIVDSLATYTTYFERAGGRSWHVHPWHYYFDLLLGMGSEGRPVFTEAVIVGLAAVGLVAAFGRRSFAGGDGRLATFLGAYALLMATIYASIPYKTPWCVLGFLHGVILLAAVGAPRLLAVPSARAARVLVGAVLGAGVVHLGWLAWAASVRFASDPRNPYVYAHTGTGVFEIARRVEALARAHPQRAGMPIEVISSENLWPLPWYLRRFSAVRWETAPVNDGVRAAVILATPEMESAILRKLYEWRRPGERDMYVPIFDGPVELRPQVEVRGYAVKTLWDEAVGR
jgi:uncharacterized protein (TIGR03663 family)